MSLFGNNNASGGLFGNHNYNKFREQSIEVFKKELYGRVEFTDTKESQRVKSFLEILCLETLDRLFTKKPHTQTVDLRSVEDQMAYATARNIMPRFPIVDLNSMSRIEFGPYLLFLIMHVPPEQLREEVLVRAVEALIIPHAPRIIPRMQVEGHAGVVPIHVKDRLKNSLVPIWKESAKRKDLSQEFYEYMILLAYRIGGDALSDIVDDFEDYISEEAAESLWEDSQIYAITLLQKFSHDKQLERFRHLVNADVAKFLGTLNEKEREPFLEQLSFAFNLPGELLGEFLLHNVRLDTQFNPGKLEEVLHFLQLKDRNEALRGLYNLMRWEIEGDVPSKDTGGYQLDHAFFIFLMHDKATNKRKNATNRYFRPRENENAQDDSTNMAELNSNFTCPRGHPLSGPILNKSKSLCCGLTEGEEGEEVECMHSWQGKSFCPPVGYVCRECPGEGKNYFACDQCVEKEHDFQDFGLEWIWMSLRGHTEDPFRYRPPGDLQEFLYMREKAQAGYFRVLSSLIDCEPEVLDIITSFLIPVPERFGIDPEKVRMRSLVEYNSSLMLMVQCAQELAGGGTFRAPDLGAMYLDRLKALEDGEADMASSPARENEVTRDVTGRYMVQGGNAGIPTCVLTQTGKSGTNGHWNFFVSNNTVLIPSLSVSGTIQDNGDIKWSNGYFFKKDLHVSAGALNTHGNDPSLFLQVNYYSGGLFGNNSNSSGGLFGNNRARPNRLFGSNHPTPNANPAAQLFSDSMEVREDGDEEMVIKAKARMRAGQAFNSLVEEGVFCLNGNLNMLYELRFEDLTTVEMPENPESVKQYGMGTQTFMESTPWEQNLKPGPRKRYAAITTLERYKDRSLEELRYEDMMGKRAYQRPGQKKVQAQESADEEEDEVETVLD